MPGHLDNLGAKRTLKRPLSGIVHHFLVVVSNLNLMCSCDCIVVLHDRLSLQQCILAIDLIRLEITWVAQAHQLGSCLHIVTILVYLRLYLWVCAEVAGPVCGLVSERLLVVGPEVFLMSLILNVFRF